MTRQQAALLLRLIQAERDYTAAVLQHAQQLGFPFPHPDSRYIEVFGATQRTAQTLADAGLVELEGRLGLQLWARLAADR